MDNNNLEKIFDFLKEIENLKSTLRYNKTTSGRTESSADHSWRLALTTFIIADELKLNLDITKSIKIALIHDIAEALTGDIDAISIADGKISNEDKIQQEKEAIIELKNTLPKSIGKEISDLWYEYEANTTKESKFIKALDKIETLTQLAETGYKIYDRPEFIANYANKAVKNFPELTDALIIVKRKLKIEFDKGNIEWKEEYDSLE
ncbi:MAG: HD domain-containing protein [Nanoarchaeota archaeon]|jgi:putative hydrolase of HD superfamily|nr:HD domain-containing protein [Nanoarchaeota archaeon]